MKRCITGFVIAATTAAAALALAAPLLMAMPGQAAARDCEKIEDRSERSQCLREEADRLIFELQVHNCARRLTKNALVTIGLEMGFTSRTTPTQIVTEFGADPEGQAQMIERALSKASERFRLMLESLLILDEENERKALTLCVETLSDGKRSAAFKERSKPPTTAQPIDVDWLDGVLAELDEPPAPEAPPEPEPEQPPQRVILGVDCSKPLTISLPDDVLIECE